LRQRFGEIAWPASNIEQTAGARQMQGRRRAALLVSGGDAAGQIERGGAPQPLVDGGDERAVHRALGERRHRRTRRFAQHVEETVPQLGGFIEQSAGQLDWGLAGAHVLSG
jgi:hypothetical protein